MDQFQEYLEDLKKSWQHNFLYPLLFQEYIYTLANHVLKRSIRSIWLERVAYDKKISSIIVKRLIIRMYQPNPYPLIILDTNSNKNRFFDYNKNLYSQILSEAFAVTAEIPFSFRFLFYLERKEKEVDQFRNLRSIHSIFSFLEDKLSHLDFVSNVRISYHIHLEILVQTLRYWLKDACSLYFLRFFLYEYCNLNRFILQDWFLKKTNPRFFLFLYNFHIWEYESIFFFLRNQSFHLRSTFYGFFFQRIYFFRKIKNLVRVKVFIHNEYEFQDILELGKDPFMHYIRYQGKSILSSNNTPIFINKWKYYFLHLWQYHYSRWSQPEKLAINQLWKQSLDFLGYLSRVIITSSVVRSQMVENSFLLDNARTKLETRVTIIPIIDSLSKARFCNRLGHPIGKPAWADSSDSDIIKQFRRICRNLSHYHSGSSKKKTLYRVKYILQLSCLKTLARKHKTTGRVFVKRFGSEVFHEFLSLRREEIVLSLIFSKTALTPRSLYRGRIWYLYITSITDLVHEKY